MHPKGINIFELHVEKIVAGVAVVLVVLLGARQVLTDPNAVKLGRTDKVSPSEVDVQIRQKADQLQRGIESNKPIPMEEFDLITEWFVQTHSKPSISSMNSSGATRSSYGLVRPMQFDGGGGGIVSMAGGQWIELLPPAPTSGEVYLRKYSLDPITVEEIPDLAARFPDGGPYDLSAVHFFAEVNGPALRERLAESKEGYRSIPTQWYDGDMVIADVVLERQKQKPDGSWSDTETAPTIPDQATVRDLFEGLAAHRAEEVLDEIESLGEYVYHPSFYTLLDGDAWSREVIDRDKPLSPETIEAEKLLKRAYGRLEKARETLERLDEREGKNRGSDTGSSGGKGGGGFEGGGEGGGSSRTGNREDRQKSAQERARQRRLDDIEKAEETYLKAKEDFIEAFPNYNRPLPDEEKPRERQTGSGGSGGRDEGGRYGPGEGIEGGEGEFVGKGGRGGTGEQRSSRQSRKSQGLFEDEKFPVWVHDIDVEPGATYRYRMRVHYYNPFFIRADRLNAEQAHLADSFTAASEPTPWSEPVYVAPQQQFFATKGNYADDIDGRSATFEIYLFSAGKYQRAVQTVKPGDPIGEIRLVRGADAEDDRNVIGVDFTTGAVLLDVIDMGSREGSLEKDVLLVVAAPDGTILLVDPAADRSQEERRRLRELVEKDEQSGG